MRDWHRINVAMTRARVKLILVLSISTFSQHSMYSDLLSYHETSGKVCFFNLRNFI